MASSGHVSYLNRERIRANVRERGAVDTHVAPPDEETTVSKDDAAQRILSRPVHAKGGARRRKAPRNRLALRVSLLGAIVVGGIALIIGLRYLAEAFGVNWIGD